MYLPLCYDPRTNPGFSVDNVWCSFFSRSPQSGEIDEFRDILFNLAGYRVSGIDLQYDWRFGLGPGEVGFNAIVSWMDEFEQQPPSGLEPVDGVGFVGNDGSAYNGLGRSRPEWKWNANLSYEWQPVTVGLRWRHIDSMRDADRSLDYRVPSFDYVDLYASVAVDAGVLAGLTLRAGVENLGDKDPPLLPSQVQANTDASQYDVLGRRYYMNLSYRF